MIIQKQYKFYAAHRNETLDDKCSNLHGHRYGLKCHFEVERDGSISTLFGDFDARIDFVAFLGHNPHRFGPLRGPLFQILRTVSASTKELFVVKTIVYCNSVVVITFAFHHSGAGSIAHQGTTELPFRSY